MSTYCCINFLYTFMHDINVYKKGARGQAISIDHLLSGQLTIFVGRRNNQQSTVIGASIAYGANDVSEADHMPDGIDHMPDGMDHMPGGIDHMPDRIDHMPNGIDYMLSGIEL